MSHPRSEGASDAFHCHHDESCPDRSALDKVFGAGVAARRDGHPLGDNPYAAGTEARQEWAAGWCATVEVVDDEAARDPMPECGGR